MRGNTTICEVLRPKGPFHGICIVQGQGQTVTVDPIFLETRHHRPLPRATLNLGANDILPSIPLSLGSMPVLIRQAIPVTPGQKPGSRSQKRLTAAYQSPQKPNFRAPSEQNVTNTGTQKACSDVHPFNL